MPDTADEEELIRMLRRRWVPAGRFPTHLIHNGALFEHRGTADTRFCGRKCRNC
jgi:hypothetical protein